jgi:hypothetical protein
MAVLLIYFASFFMGLFNITSCEPKSLLYPVFLFMLPQSPPPLFAFG